MLYDGSHGFVTLASALLRKQQRPHIMYSPFHHQLLRTSLYLPSGQRPHHIHEHLQLPNTILSNRRADRVTYSSIFSGPTKTAPPSLPSYATDKNFGIIHVTLLLKEN